MTYVLLFIQCICSVGLILLFTSYFGVQIKHLRHQRDVLYENLGLSLYTTDVPLEWNKVLTEIDEERTREAQGK